MTPHRIIHRVLAVRSTRDPILHHIAPLGLAASVGRCIVIDLDEAAPPYSEHCLAALIEDGLTARDLEVGDGVAVLSNGGVAYDQAVPVIELLAAAWGRVVIRAGVGAHPFPVVTVEPLLPAPFEPDDADVVQALIRGQRSDGRPLLPRLGHQQLRSLLAGQIEPRWRWTRSWLKVWSHPWA